MVIDFAVTYECLTNSCIKRYRGLSLSSRLSVQGDIIVQLRGLRCNIRSLVTALCLLDLQAQNLSGEFKNLVSYFSVLVQLASPFSLVLTWSILPAAQ